MNFKNNALFFAPMEGVTDAYFRQTIQDLYPQWDYLCTDFLRVPAAGRYPPKHLNKHFGLNLLDDEEHRQKTIYQILATEKSFIEDIVTSIGELDFKYLDLNLGCPSKTVCRRMGGSYLLSDLKALESVLGRIRKSFPHFLSAKIRVGFSDDSLFLDILKLLENQGIQTITIHGRTREQLYKGVANWKYIAQAKKHVSTPIIGNGDIWSVNDIQSIFEQTGCDGVMIGRGALKKPWLAKEYYDNSLDTISEIKTFFNHYSAVLNNFNVPEHFQHKRFKGLTRYMFDELKSSDRIKRNLYLSTSKSQYLEIISGLDTSQNFS